MNETCRIWMKYQSYQLLIQNYIDTFIQNRAIPCQNYRIFSNFSDSKMEKLSPNISFKNYTGFGQKQSTIKLCIVFKV